MSTTFIHRSAAASCTDLTITAYRTSTEHTAVAAALARAAARLTASAAGSRGACARRRRCPGEDTRHVNLAYATGELAGRRPPPDWRIRAGA